MRLSNAQPFAPSSIPSEFIPIQAMGTKISPKNVMRDSLLSLNTMKVEIYEVELMQHALNLFGHTFGKGKSERF